jgi:hypothetical protein
MGDRTLDPELGFATEPSEEKDLVHGRSDGYAQDYFARGSPSA